MGRVRALTLSVLAFGFLQAAGASANVVNFNIANAGVSEALSGEGTDARKGAASVTRRGTAPVITLSTKTLRVTAGRPFNFRSVASVIDRDGGRPIVRFLNLPAGVSAGRTFPMAFGLKGRIARAGRHTITVFARDRAGNASSERMLLLVRKASRRPTGGATPPPYTMMDSPEAVVRFLMRAGFGGTKDEIDALVGTDAADWVKAQIAMPAESVLRAVVAGQGRAQDHLLFTQLNYDQMLGTDDHLRERMKFALSQILVVRQVVNNAAVMAAHYSDILSDHAFGNYRDLLEDVTYSPMMGRLLTYNGNKKGDPEKGRTPDENYAREILQLFTIGIAKLDKNGEVVRRRGGRIADSYTQKDIEGLARVFTGLKIAASGTVDHTTNNAYYRPMTVFPEDHSPLAKQFLGHTIPARTRTRATIARALDHIFSHPNVGPFIGRQLIQRFTASHPSPGYLRRVARAFNRGSFVAPGGQRFGTGRRGDLEATIAAVLLDASLFDDRILPQNGKIREPLLRFAGWAHSFGLLRVDSIDQKPLRISAVSNNPLGQHPYGALSVFNFYRPGFVAPGTTTGRNNLTAPELQISTAVSRLGFANFMSTFIFDETQERSSRNTYIPDYSDLTALVDTPRALVDHLDLYLTGNRMDDATRRQIDKVVRLYEIRPEQQARDKLLIAKLAVTMAVTSPAFTVIY